MLLSIQTYFPYIHDELSGWLLFDILGFPSGNIDLERLLDDLITKPVTE